MKQLSDLLEAATAEAPPARYDVEDAVAAGRRLQRRRNTGWAIAAVTAVAIAIGVPQIATRGSARPVQPVVTTTTTTPPAVKPRSFVYPFTGYPVGRFRVDDPISVTLGNAQAPIWPASGSGPISGFLTLYQPGAVDVGSIFGSYENIATAPINGRRAVFLDPKGAVESPMWGLAWEYTDGGWVFAWSRLGRVKKAELIQVVKRLPLGSQRPVRLAFRTSYVPDGYRLVQVDGPDRGSTVSGTLFASATSGGQQRSEAGLRAVPNGLGNDLLIRLTRLATDERAEWPATVPLCPKKEQYCYRSLDGGRYLLTVSSGKTGVGRSELLKTLQAITVADGDDQSTWTDVNSAMPASARLPAD
jgi:hypothetical protein